MDEYVIDIIMSIGMGDCVTVKFIIHNPVALLNLDGNDESPGSIGDDFLVDLMVEFPYFPFLLPFS